MEEFIARENIRRYEAQLDDCNDEKQKEVLLKLLEAERRHLANLQSSSRQLREIPDSTKAP